MEVELILSYTTIVIALAAIFATIINGWYNALQIKKAMWSQNIIKLREIYAHEDMIIGLKEIRKWYINHNNNTKRAVDDFIKNRYIATHTANKIDSYRRRFSHYLYTIHSLRKQNTVDDKFVKLMVKKDTIKFLKKYVEPLEKAIREQEDIEEVPAGKDTFDFYYELFNL
ncbi:MAG: hypothetical protein JSW06_03945 [Thermoplasmatales archaeon]|nr:MAG: hypothetical protein JSW06_03945 [Thermoplasmatales archaeon]